MAKYNFSWIHPKLRSKAILKYGINAKGVFASKDIPKGETLAVFGGYVIDFSKKSEIRKFEKDGDFCLQVSDRFLMGITNRSDLTSSDYFNHSCQPNAGFKGQVFLQSMRRIRTGEEVTFDYAMVIQHMPGVEPYMLTCLCGASTCRGCITENDWKIKSLQIKYKGYFNTFIQEKIDKKTKS